MCVCQRLVSLRLFTMDQKVHILDRFWSLLHIVLMLLAWTFKHGEGLKSPSCPQGWQSFDSFCYFFNSNGRSWTNARDYCKNYGSELTSILSNAENNFVNSIRGGQNTWIGLNDRANEGAFAWQDGNTVGFTDWDTGEPSGGGEDCVNFNTRSNWNDIACGNAFAFVCKLKGVQFWIESPTYVGKEGGAIDVTVYRYGLLTNSDRLTLTANDDTAIYGAGADFTASGMAADVNFNAGDTAVTITYTIASDGNVEGVESFTLALTLRGRTASGSNAGVYAEICGPSTATVFIMDCSFIFWIDSVYIGEEGSIVDVIVRRGGFLGNADDSVVISTSTAGTTAATDDFTPIPANTEVTFEKGSEAEEYEITLLRDTLVEGIEYFQVSIMTVGGTNAASGSIDAMLNTANVFILDLSSIFWINPMYVGEEGRVVNVHVHRAGYLGHITSIGISLTAKTATATDDYTTVPALTTVDFTDGEVVKEMPLTLMTDQVVEGVEYFQAELGTVTGDGDTYSTVDMGLKVADIFILDLSTIFWIDSMYVGEEGSTVNAYVHRAGYLGHDTTIGFSLIPQTAIAMDYVVPGALTINFVDSQVIGVIGIALESDALVEGIEYFQLELDAVTSDTSSVDAGLMTANIFVLDLTSYFWIEEKQYIAFEETTNFEVTFHRGGYLGRIDTIMVAYTDARAMDAVDYIPDADTTVTFADDVTAVSKEINILPDNILEYNEMFFLSIMIPGGPGLMDTARLDSPAVAEVIIKDPTWYVFDCADFTIIESSGTVTITINRRGDVRTTGHIFVATRDFDTPRDLSASSLLDYTPIDVMVSFVADQLTETVIIDITSDDLLESDEQFQVYLYDPDTAEALGDLHKAIVTIYDDDSLYEFEKVVYHLTESDLSVTIKILRLGSFVVSTSGSVEISTVDRNENRLLTAEDGTDFIGFEGEVIKFPVNDDIESYTILLVESVDVDKQEYFEVCMDNPVSGIVGGSQCAIIYIEDDDSVYGFDQPVYYVKEDESVTINVVRLGCLKNQGSVEISTFDVSTHATNDYHAISNRPLSFDIQQTNHTLELVTAAPDNHVEGEERLQMCLDKPFQGVLGLIGLIRCTTVVIEDCDSEIYFGDPSYSVTENTGTVHIKVKRRGYLSSIVSVDVVSSSVTAKEGITKDFFPVHHTVVFGALDSPEEAMVSFQVQIRDDDIVEITEQFYLSLVNVVGALIGEPSVAEVSIGDDDVTYRFGKDSYTVFESNNELVLTVIREGYLDQETSIGILTRDKSTSSTVPNQDYLPLLEISAHGVVFQPDETMKTVVINIVDDAFFEASEEFEVSLTSDVVQQLSYPSKTVVTIISDDIQCALECQNGGFCVSPEECQCAEGYTGSRCEEDVNECVILPPVCVGDKILCFNRIGSYECACTDPEYILEGNTCVRETRDIIGRLYANELNGQPIRFVNAMYDTKSNEFKLYADLIEPELGNTIGSVDGYQDVSLLRLFPTDSGIGAVYGVTVESTSSADETDINVLIAANTSPEGYLGNTLLSIAGPIAQFTRTVDGVFYATDADSQPFDLELLDTTSEGFQTFATDVETELEDLFRDLQGFHKVRVSRVFPVGNLIGVDYEVTVAASSSVKVDDLNEFFDAKTQDDERLRDTDLILMSPGDSCLPTYCENDGVCKVLTDFSFECICDTGFFGERCQDVVPSNSTTGISTGVVIGISVGIGVSSLAVIFAALVVFYMRLPNNNPRIGQLPISSRGPQLAFNSTADGYIGQNSQISPAFPSLLNMPSNSSGAYNYNF